MATITLQGNEIHTNGKLPAVGSQAPDFSLTTKELGDVTLADFAGKKKLISIVPSLDTPICQISTKKFNDHAKDYADTVILVVSADLPFAMSRFCGDENLENVVSLSMMHNRNFAKDYGVLIKDGPLKGITARALITLDENNMVLTSELVGEIAEEPNYEAALAVLK